MHKRLIMGVLLTVALVGLTGCPPQQASAGTWIFTIVGFANPFAVDLLEGGSTQDPDPVPAGVDLFDGTVTWMQNGANFTMSQVATNFTVTYTGTVNSSTSMDGTWVSTDLGPAAWSAEKL